MVLKGKGVLNVQILGYLGYAILIFFAVVWAVGVRRMLTLVLPTIMGALFYMLAAIFLGVSGVNKWHSWWLLPAGYGVIWLCTMILAAETPVLSWLIRQLGSTYANIIRRGIPAEAINLKRKMDVFIEHL
jgi:hypothetical protein